MSYIFKPLAGSDIRVVYLEEGLDGKPLCRIKHVDFDSAKYVALSYAWGDSGTKVDVNVTVPGAIGTTKLQTLSVTKNLGEALKDLLKVPGPKVFWIDQICVNQKDEEDKAANVKRMRYLYPHAQSVLTYMGPDNGKDEQAIALFQNLCSLYVRPFIKAYQRDDLWQWLMTLEIQLSQPAIQKPQILQFAFPGLPVSNGEVNDGVNEQLRTVLEDPLPKSSAWPDLLSILTGDWGQRRWMMQENVLHPNTELLRGTRRLNHMELLILCGILRFKLYNRELPTAGQPNANGAGQLSTNARLTDEQMKKLSNASMIYRALRSKTHEGGKNLHELLHWFRNAETGRPQDQVFALMSFAQDTDQLNIAVDYSEQFPRLEKGAKPHVPAKIMTKTSVAVLKRHGLSLYLKQREDENKNRPKDMPTWAPIWEMGSHTTGLVQPDRNCSNRLGSYIRFQDDDKTLVVKSLIIGTVKRSIDTVYRKSIDHLILPSSDTAGKVLTQKTVGNAFMEATRYLQSRGIKDLPYVLGCTYLARSTWLDRHKKHGRQGCGCEDQTSRCEECAQEIRDGYTAAMGILTGAEIPGGNGNHSLGVDFIRSLGVHSGQLAVVGDDLPCWIPLDAREDDVVCKLVGGVAAFVLRPSQENCGDCQYAMIGTAYAPGYMDGEAYKLANNWADTAPEIQIV